MPPMDRLTQFVDKVLKLLLANFPSRTGLGAAIGLATQVVTLIFEPVLKTITYFNLTQLPFWSWPVVGIVLMNARTIITVLEDDTVGDEQIDRAVKLIKQSGMPAAVKQQQYVLLIGEAIEELRLRPKRGTQLRAD